MKYLIQLFQDLVSRFIHPLSVIFKDKNINQHYVFGIIVIFFSIYIGLNYFSLVIIILMVFLVIVAEIFNTAIEHLADKVSKEYDKDIKLVKDFASLAVLMIALASVIIYLILLGGHYAIIN